MKTTLGHNLGWKTEEELFALGLLRDDLLRIRDTKGKYICGITGDSHDKYLRLYIDYDHASGKSQIVWICDHGYAAIYEGVIADVARVSGPKIAERVGAALIDCVRFLVRLVLSKAGLTG